MEEQESQSNCKTQRWFDSIDYNVVSPKMMRFFVWQVQKRIEEKLQRKNIPQDGSCLMAAIDYLVSNGVVNVDAPLRLRNKVASSILRDNGQRFTEPLLGKEPREYASWILHPLSYGGEIEIAIFAELLNVTIKVVSMESMTILTYAPTSSTKLRQKTKIYLLYTGIDGHYDAIVGSDGQCIFDDIEGDEEYLDNLALDLAMEQKVQLCAMNMPNKSHQQSLTSAAEYVHTYAKVSAVLTSTETVKYEEEWSVDDD